MDFEKLNLIKQAVLKTPLEPKLFSHEAAGVYVEGGNRPFLFEEHDAPFHSFRAFSQKEYPIYLFVNRYHTEGVEELCNKYTNVKVTLIEELTNSYHYNWWMINRCFNLISPRHENLITFQSDGFLLKSGWEDYCSNYDYLGALWKEPISLSVEGIELPATRIGNGGFSFRKLSKLIKVQEAVDKIGGQKAIKGMLIDGEVRLKTHLVNEDIFFTYFGFGMEIFKPISNNEINRFSLEPIKYSEFLKKPAWGFHKIDE